MDRDRKSLDVQAQLAALADGTLPEGEREQVLALAGDSPELAGDLERQRDAVATLHSLQAVQAPPTLHRSIKMLAADASTQGRSRTLRLRFGRPRPRFGRPNSRPLRVGLTAAGAIAAGAAAALAIALSAQTPGEPTVRQAASVALRPATLPAPVQSRRSPAQLTRSVDGVAYPYWQDSFGWRAAGARTDRLDGRTVTTVFYAPARAEGASYERIGYAIVAGRALPVPGGRVIDAKGTRFHVLDSNDATVVTWRRAGHTCVLVAHGVGGAELVRLASWQ